MAGEQAERAGLERRLRSSRRLLIFVLIALGIAAVLAHVQRDRLQQTQQHLLTATVADRFMELALRARMLAQFDPDVVANGGMLADGLFDGQAVNAAWDTPVRIQLTLHVGEPSLMVIEVSGLPQQPCPAFASRVLQRAAKAGVLAVRVNGTVHGVRGSDTPEVIEACTGDNAVALIIAVPQAREWPRPPVLLRV